MSKGLYTHTTRANGSILTATIYNADHQNHIDNLNPTESGAFSDSIAQMRIVTDPGITGAEHLAANLAEELGELRFCIQRIAGTPHWYDVPTGLYGGQQVFISTNGDTLAMSFGVSGGRQLQFDWVDDLTGQRANMEVGRNTIATDLNFSVLFPSTSNPIFRVRTDNGGSVDGAVLASDVEAKAPSIDYKLITPATLATATDARLSDQATAEAGTDAVKLMTPLRVQQAISKQANRRLHVRASKAVGTAGGSSVSGNYVARNLDTVMWNTITGSSLSSDQITLPKGTYEVDGRAPAYGSGVHKATLYNVTDGATTIVGSAADSGTTTPVQTDSRIIGVFTITGTKKFELQHRVTTSKATDGLGRPTGFTGSPEREVYSEIIIRKIGP
jgi:hypothetical protein